MEKSILEDIRVAVGLTVDTPDFDTELIMHINAAIGKLHQNDVCAFLIVKDNKQTWKELQDPLKVEGNKYFSMVPLFITLSTKLIFDPPPPSTVEYYSKNIDDLLWRLKTFYEDFTILPSNAIDTY